MEKMLKYLAVFIMIAMVGCAPNELSKPDLGSLPSANSVSVTTTADDELPYRVVFEIADSKVVGVWDFGANGGTVVGNKITMDFPFSGDQTASLKVYNKAGVSTDSKEVPFSVEQGSATIPGTPGYLLLQKPWVWDKDTPGHIGNGPSDATAPAWWNASPNELASAGCYDDILHFNDDGTFVLEAHGDVAVNERAAIQYAGVSEQPGGTTKYPYVEPTGPVTWSISGSSLKISGGGFPSYVLPDWATLTYTVLTLDENTLFICAPNTKDGNNRFFMRFIHP